MASPPENNDRGSSQSYAPVVDFMAGGQLDRPSDTVAERDENSYTQRDIIHYHYFGRHGVPVSTRATLSSWKRRMPFVKPITIEWKVQLSEHHLLRLLYGYEPLEMPDKWFIYADGPNRAGNIIINFIRSWTGKRAAEILIRTANEIEKEHGLWTGEVIELTFEGDDEEAERIADASIEKSQSTHNSLDESEARKNTELSELDTDTKTDKSLEQKTTEQDIVDQSERENSLSESIDSRTDESGENWTKFLVVTACKWVMGIDLGVDILEPKRWTKLASRPAKSESITQTTYMGTTMPQETMELLQRLGPGTIVTFS
jgi:hypothetical protein